MYGPVLDADEAEDSAYLAEFETYMVWAQEGTLTERRRHNAPLDGMLSIAAPVGPHVATPTSTARQFSAGK